MYQTFQLTACLAVRMSGLLVESQTHSPCLEDFVERAARCNDLRLRSCPCCIHEVQVRNAAVRQLSQWQFARVKVL